MCMNMVRLKYIPQKRQMPLMERLTLRDMAELSVGGGMTGSKFFEAPGAAGVTCTTLEQKGIPNVVMADGPAGLRLNKVSSVSFTGKGKREEPIFHV